MTVVPPFMTPDSQITVSNFLKLATLDVNMSPSIPSPTPIQGVQNPDGSQAPPGPRLPLAELQQNDFAFALYVQALLAWQQDGDEAKDSDSNTATSYFQVTGKRIFVFLRSQSCANVIGYRCTWNPICPVAE